MRMLFLRATSLLVHLHTLSLFWLIVFVCVSFFLFFLFSLQSRYFDYDDDEDYDDSDDEDDDDDENVDDDFFWVCQILFVLSPTLTFRQYHARQQQQQKYI